MPIFATFKLAGGALRRPLPASLPKFHFPRLPRLNIDREQLCELLDTRIMSVAGVMLLGIGYGLLFSYRG